MKLAGVKYFENPNELVSLRILFYNQEKYVRESVQAALSQDYEPLQIVFSDDCSSDRTFEIIKEMVAEYEGPHRVQINQTKKNLGLGGHLIEVNRLLEGDLIVCGAGDDLQTSDRVSKIHAKWKNMSYPSCAIFSQYYSMSDDGEILGIGGDTDATEWRNNQSFHQVSDLDPKIMGSYPGCTISQTRDEFDVFGPIPEHVYQNDVIRQLRCAMLGGIAFVPKPLVYYRKTPSSVSRIGRCPPQEWRRKKVTYLERFITAMAQFEADADKALSLGYIDEETRNWAVLQADKYKQQRMDEIEFYSGSLIKRVKASMSNPGFKNKRMKSLVEALFPILARRLRG